MSSLETTLFNVLLHEFEDSIGLDVLDLGHELFSLHWRATATLDELDGGRRVRSISDCHQRLQSEQHGGGDRLVSPVMLTDVIKLIAVTYSNLLKEVFDPWLDHILPLLLNTLVFMSNNAISHSIRVTQALPGYYGIQGDRLMAWPPASPDINPIGNLWFIVKQDIYTDWLQFTSKIISQTCYEKRKLTDFMINKVFVVILWNTEIIELKASNLHIGKPFITPPYSIHSNSLFPWTVEQTHKKRVTVKFRNQCR